MGIAGRVLMEIDRDLESKMRSATTNEEKSRNARGRHAKDNLGLSTYSIAESVVDISLSRSTSPIQEETLPD